MAYRVNGIEGPGGFTATARRIRLATLLAMVAFAAAVAQGQNPAAAPRPTNPTTLPSSGTLPTPNPVPFRLDHFLCYLVQPVQFLTKQQLALIDQFNPKPRPFALTERQWLCNPVSKNGGPIHNPRGHLTGYVMKEATTPPLNIPVMVGNQFGNQRFIVLQQNRLFVPTGKAPLVPTTTAVPPPPPIPQGLDHFACYAVKPESTVPHPGVVLSDQFGKLQGEVVEPAFLCNPAQKFVDNKPTGQIINPRDHLMCYLIKTEGFQGRKVEIHNQFETVAIEAGRPEVLCVPSTKQPLKIPPPGVQPNPAKQ